MPTAADARPGSARGAPLWFITLVLGVVVASFAVASDPYYANTLRVLSRGLAVTIRVTLSAFALALVIGVIAGLARVSSHRLAREAATLYVEAVRGVPLLVLILWVGFGLTPWLLETIRETLAQWEASGRLVAGLIPALSRAMEPCRRPQDCISREGRGILGLAIGYGAYLAEIVRAGLQSVPIGQREAASSLGMTSWQVMRRVIMPQALRLALPPLGNDFIAMLKDSSLVSLLAVPEIVQRARSHISRTAVAFGVWNVVALMYLVMTLALSLGVRYLERRMEKRG